MRLKQYVLLAIIVLAIGGCASFLSSGGTTQPGPQPQTPTQTLPLSLHGTASGMQWWYEQSDGAGALFNVAYDDTGCGSCHIETCDQCHANPDGSGGVNEPDSCKVCHGRLAKEEQLGVTDVHFTAGMVCSDCHSAEDMHGDGTTPNSMLATNNVSCEDCHARGASAVDVPNTQPHTVHGDALSCDACHMASAVTCYNCHFESLLESHEKKPAGAFKDFVFLLNDEDGQVRAGTYQSVTYDGNTFVAFGPFHGHSVTADGRVCADCHDNDRIQELNETGKIVIAEWNETEGKVEHTTGAIPFVPDSFEFQFLDFDGTAWQPTTTVLNQLQYKFCTPLTTDQLTSLGYTGEGAASFVGYESCNTCHSEQVTAWMATGHSEIEEIMQQQELGHLESCRVCHNTGYGEGGYVDYATTPQFANVQCEECHGTGVGHPANGPLSTSMDAAICGACHTDAHHPTYDEWLVSGHGTFALDSHEATGANCVRCHTGDWFLRIQVNGDDPPAEDLDPEVNPGMNIVCATCHDPHSSANEHQLRIDPEGSVMLAFMDTEVEAGKGNMCIACHDGRRTESDRDGHITNGSGHFGPHANAQGPMLFGISAVELADPLPGPHAHAGIDNTCITCHMRAKDFEDTAPAITGHEFRPVYEACVGCHTDAATAEALADNFKTGLDAKLAEFVDAWPAAWKDVTDAENPVLYNRPDTNDPPEYDGPPLDDPIGNRYREALWNYLLVIDDGSHGVHNPTYAYTIVQDAIDTVNQLNGVATFSYVGYESCNLCHSETVTTWLETGHSMIENTMQERGLGGIESCRECHNTGYGDGGYVDFELTPQFANVQCESCHGSGMGHPANGPLPVILDASLCGTCHTDAHHPTYDEWEVSGHGTLALDSHQATAANCIRCHTGDWFLRIQINGEDPPAEDLDPNVNPGMHIVCASCHNPHSAENEHQLRVSSEGAVTLAFMDTEVEAGKGNLCIACHDGRRTEGDRDSHVVNGSAHFGPHANAQGPMLFGVSAVEFDGPYSSSHAHKGIDNTCITCHMRAKDFEDTAPAITGHEFRPVYEACVVCHLDVATVTTIADEFKTDLDAKLAEFVDAWPAAWKDVTDPNNPILYNRPDTADPPTYDGPPVDDVVGNQYREALWNYLLILDDGSSGIHNPVYAMEIIQASIDKVNELNAL